MYMSLSHFCLHIVCIVLKIILHIPYHIYDFLHQVIVRHCHTMLTWHDYSEHVIITNRLLIRIISMAYTVLQSSWTINHRVCSLSLIPQHEQVLTTVNYIHCTSNSSNVWYSQVHEFSPG